MQDGIVSQYKKNNDGKWYLEVGGAPFLFHCIQGRTPSDNISDRCFKVASGLAFNMLALRIDWGVFEPRRGTYRLNMLDEILGLAETYSIRLDLLWNGAGTDYSSCRFEAESNALEALIRHLKDNDACTRVISLQIEIDYDSARYAAPTAGAVIYANRLAGVINSQDYKIASRVTVAARDNLQNLGAYTADIQFTKRMLRSGDATRFKYSDGDPALGNTAAHIAEALACGAFYSRYIHGFGDGEYRDDARYASIMNLNRALNRASEVVAEASPNDMKAFGITSGCVLRGKAFKVTPDVVGLVVYREEYVYIFSNGDTVLYLPDAPAEASVGEFSRGVWTAERSRLADCRMENGQYQLPLYAGECARVAFSPEGGIL